LRSASTSRFVRRPPGSQIVSDVRIAVDLPQADPISAALAFTIVEAERRHPNDPQAQADHFCSVYWPTRDADLQELRDLADRFDVPSDLRDDLVSTARRRGQQRCQQWRARLSGAKRRPVTPVRLHVTPTLVSRPRGCGRRAPRARRPGRRARAGAGSRGDDSGGREPPPGDARRLRSRGVARRRGSG
jgi:hypothetical protein